MSKELTPLKAHKELLNRYGKHFSMQDDERARVIKRAIEENKTLKKCYENELKNSAYYNNLALKYKKAVEIINNRQIDVYMLKEAKKLEDYNNFILELHDFDKQEAESEMLTQEEYDFLKEVFK